MKNLKPIFIENSKIPKLLSYFAPIKINAITIGLIVFSRGKINIKTKRHETIHFQQFIETLIIGMLLLYIFDFIKNYIKYKNSKKAYYNVRAEKEAYMNEKNINYLKNRIRWDWI